jgi:hypothetical protein
MGLLEVTSNIKNIFCCLFKHSSFWPSADGKPMANDQMHAMPHAVHVSSIYVHTTVSILFHF